MPCLTRSSRWRSNSRVRWADESIGADNDGDESVWGSAVLFDRKAANRAFIPVVPPLFKRDSS